ncbi:MAG: peptidase S41 [Chloroflexaceae bacterium]|nr:peptidase S41 [Chloroflexaceae bacterium]
MFHNHLMVLLAITACIILVSCNANPIPGHQATELVSESPDSLSTPDDPTNTDEPTNITTTLVAATDQPVLITGEFEYTNSIITDYYVEHAVALVDMNGFVERDQEWDIPLESQTLGFLDINPEAMSGSFWLQLPAQPTGTMVNLDPANPAAAGVQVFAISYWPNLTGGPYSEGDDRSQGWPAYLASIRADTENDDEIIGGKLVVWAPDAMQSFPSSYGPDELLFTDDDPLQTLPAGYSVIDLDTDPFTIIRDSEASLTLYEPEDVAIKNFADLSYTEAFDQMFEQVRREYAFNGIEGKEPDWDGLYDTLAPRVAEAEDQNDANLFYAALVDFTDGFRDGHVGLNGGSLSTDYLVERAIGGYGLALRELDDGRVLVVYVGPDTPAETAGMEVGAEVTAFNGMPVSEAIDAVQPPIGPFSTDFGKRYEQVRFLTRTAPGNTAEITFVHPGDSPETVTLTAEQEIDSLFVTDPLSNADPNALPVEFRLLDSGVGYVRINSNYDDLNLIIRLFERALKTFEDNSVPGIIIDMRYNSGGAPLGLAGFLTDETILSGQREYYSDQTGQFEPEGPRERVWPNENQYRFNSMVLLVGQSCYSACEEESYGFSQVPEMQVVGLTPTGGVYAEVARGQYRLPEDISLQVPTGRSTLPDGSIFLEGVGVVPDIRIPTTEEVVLAEAGEDIVLQQAESVVLQGSL